MVCLNRKTAVACGLRIVILVCMCWRVCVGEGAKVGREGWREGGGQVKRKVGGCSTTHSPERRLYHCRWPSILTPPSGCGHLYLYLVSVKNQFCEACELRQFIHSAFLVREREMQMKLPCW